MNRKRSGLFVTIWCRTVEISVRDKELFHFSKQVKLQNASNITKEIAEAGYRLYKDNYRLPADDKELKAAGQSFFKSHCGA